MLQFYVVDNLWKGTLDIHHFRSLSDAIRAYRTLPAANRKALGVQRGADAIDLVQCLPLFPNDREGEDVMTLRFLEFPLWKSDPQVMEMALDLASRLHIRYCLFRGCLLPVPDREKLPRALRDRYLWPDEPGDFDTAAQWIYTAGVGRLPAAEFKRRYFVGASSASLVPPRTGELTHSAASPLPTKPEGRLCGALFSGGIQYPLVVHISACGMDGRGNYKALQVSPWEFHLLARRSQERLDQNKKEKRNLK